MQIRHARRPAAPSTRSASRGLRARRARRRSSRRARSRSPRREPSRSGRNASRANSRIGRNPPAAAESLRTERTPAAFAARYARRDVDVSSCHVHGAGCDGSRTYGAFDTRLARSSGSPPRRGKASPRRRSRSPRRPRRRRMPRRSALPAVLAGAGARRRGRRRSANSAPLEAAARRARRCSSRACAGPARRRVLPRTGVHARLDRPAASGSCSAWWRARRYGVRRPRAARPRSRSSAEGLIGLGAGILYLSLWAAVALFPWSAAVALIAMFAVTAALDRARGHAPLRALLALLGLAGGFVTPVLLADGPVDQHVLLAALPADSHRRDARARARGRFRSSRPRRSSRCCATCRLFALDDAHGWSRADVLPRRVAVLRASASAFSLSAIRCATQSRRCGWCCSRSTSRFTRSRWRCCFVESSRPLLGVALLGLAAVLLGRAGRRRCPACCELAYGYLGLAAVTLARPGAAARQTPDRRLRRRVGGCSSRSARARGDRCIVLAGSALFGLTGSASSRTHFETMLPPLLNPLSWPSR